MKTFKINLMNAFSQDILEFFKCYLNLIDNKTLQMIENSVN